MERVRLEELARRHVRPGAAVWAQRDGEVAAIVRPSYGKRGACGAAPVLLVEVPRGSEDPVRMVRVALEYLGLGVVLH